MATVPAGGYRQLPPPPGPVSDVASYLQQVEDTYLTDAYNSLSIEGYRVNAELIERVRSGNWNPQVNPTDRAHLDAMAARGYWQAFQAVKQSVARVLQGGNAGNVVSRDLDAWYRELFAPSVVAGILSPGSLAGYRNHPVYIRHSQHVPPNYEVVRELMPALFELMENEPDPAVNAVLSHFFFVYIHPYMDGNGRCGRFLTNVMMAAGGYPWTVVPLEQRDAYMDALEKASVAQDILYRLRASLPVCWGRGAIPETLTTRLSSGAYPACYIHLSQSVHKRLLSVHRVYTHSIQKIRLISCRPSVFPDKGQTGIGHPSPIGIAHTTQTLINLHKEPEQCCTMPVICPA